MLILYEVLFNKSVQLSTIKIIDLRTMNSGKKQAIDLITLKTGLDERELNHFSQLATLSKNAVRRIDEEQQDHRQSFSIDADRILHSRAYTRYIDKTQVFYMVRNDHITHRVLHVQLVSKIARTIGRLLGLNEDLIEAIALGHDIGHPPFGHDGEKVLSDLCRQNGLHSFQHNIQSVNFLDCIEKKGKGWNLTLQTLDGILCHDGEIHNRVLQPKREKNFYVFDKEKELKAELPKTELVPMTLEGCVVRFSDTIGYIGRDIEDAIELGLINRKDIPVNCQNTLGNTNGTIVYRLVEDLITNSTTSSKNVGIQEDSISFSAEKSESLMSLKKFNYENIYLNPLIKKEYHRISKCYSALFESYMEDIVSRKKDSAIYKEYRDTSGKAEIVAQNPAEIVRDFIAGMTDDFFLDQAALLGCEVPQKS